MITIRQAEKHEGEALQLLSKELFADNGVYDPDLNLDWSMSEKGKKYFTKALNNPKSACFVGVDHGRLIGYMFISSKKMDYRKSRWAEIVELCVSMKYQSQGIGSKLIERAVMWAKENGYQKLFLSCYFHNTRARAFYRKNGLTEIEVGLEMNL
jgi:ribosomal protein S18 acetylase RimI-like enzyme